MDPRLSYENFTKAAPGAYGGLAALGKAVDESGLEKSLTELVKLRTSQVNGCAFCVSFHLNILRKLGVAPEKIDLLPVWREAVVYSERDIAALASTAALSAPPPDAVSPPPY